MGVASKTILVLNLVPQTLAVVRSLGRAGFDVVLGRSCLQEKTEAEWSRYCRKVWIHPDFSAPEAFDRALGTFLDEQPELHAIFPVAEPAIQALLAASCLQDRSVNVAMIQESLFFACQHKERANELAERAGLRVPETLLVDTIESLRQAREDLGIPLIIKSVRSEALVHGRKAFMVRSDSVFDSVFSSWPSGHRDLLVQRLIEGPLVSSQFVASNGRLVGYCDVTIIRSTMPDGTGLGIEFESNPPAPDLLRAVQDFARVHNYSGPGLMQFIRDDSSRELYFIENNPRLGAGIAHTIGCGQDLPVTALQVATRKSDSLPEFDPEHHSYRYHYRTHWLRRDIGSLMSLRSELSREQRIKWVRQMLISFLRADGHVIWQWRDPLPALHVYGLLLRRIVGKLFAGIFGRPDTGQ